MFKDLVELRNDTIEDITGWLWPKEDTELWEGPKVDWEISHVNAITRVRGNQVAVQAGGGCGMYPRLLANRFSWVYTFEPDFLNFHCLVNNCQHPNIMKFQGALGNRRKPVTLHRAPSENAGMHQIRYDIPGAIPCFMLDDFDLHACDLLMIDTERTERQALEGCVETIKKFHPLILVELGNVDGITEFLQEFGYVFDGQSRADWVFVWKE